MTRKVGPPCELQTLLELQKGRFGGTFRGSWLEIHAQCRAAAVNSHSKPLSLAKSKLTLPRLPDIEGANYAGIMSAGCDSLNFESETSCSGTSPLQDPRTVDLRFFRGVWGAPTSSRSVRG